MGIPFNREVNNGFSSVFLKFVDLIKENKENNENKIKNKYVKDVYIFFFNL